MSSPSTPVNPDSTRFATASGITTVSIPDGNDAALLTLSEAAAVLRVPVNTMRWWRQQRSGPAFFKIGRNLVTTVGDLRSWIEEQKNNSGPDAA